jgi:hypothetical protein
MAAGDAPYGLPNADTVKDETSVMLVAEGIGKIMLRLAHYCGGLGDSLRPRLIRGLTAEGFETNEARAQARKITAPLDECASHLVEAMGAARTFKHHFWTHYINAIRDKRAERKRGSADGVKV